MSGHGEKRGRKAEQALAALLLHANLAAAAAACGVNERTLRRWLRQPRFAREYARRKREVVEAAVARLQRTMGAAVDTLRALLSCDHPGTRCRAAVEILQQGLAGLQLLDTLDRLARVEKLLAERGKKP